MDQNDSVILVSTEMSGRKRKHSGYDSSDNVNDVESAPKHPLLESVSSRFQQNRVERDKKMAVQNSKRETEKAHSNYLKQNVVDPQELAKASYAASYWAKKNGIRDTVPSNTNLPGHTGVLSKKQAKKQRNRQNNLPMLQNKPVISSTATSTSQLPTSEEESNVSILSLRNKAGELTQTHMAGPSSEGKYICPVLYCEAEFRSEGSLGQHMNLFEHSPCNPLRLCEDCKLLPDPVCYKCPDCDIEFDTNDLCKEHMETENHLVFYPPLAIMAYLCPQCLYLFKNFQSCLIHMENAKHYSFKFPFTDDENDGEFNVPVTVAKEFVQDYMKKCRKIAYQVQCLHCGMDILSPAQFRHHQNETNNVHVMCSLTDKVLADVFIKYINEYSCNKCYRLFDKQPLGDSRHICAGGIVGNIKPGLVRTTSEFLKYCAFSLITSLKGKKRGKKSNQKMKHDTSDTRYLEVERPEEEDFSLDFEYFEQSNVVQKLKQEIPKTLPHGSVKKENITETGYQYAVEGNFPETFPPISIKKERTLEPITQNRIEPDTREMLPKSSVKKESSTESMCPNSLKQGVTETLPCGAVKKENASEPQFQNVMEQELPAMLPNDCIKEESKTELMYLNRLKQDIPETLPSEPIKEECKTEPMWQYRVKNEKPSTSTGRVPKENTAMSQDSDSDVELMEIDDSVDEIVISDSDDLMIVEDQEDIKPKSEMDAMDVSPSKKKKKKKKKKAKNEGTKKEIKERRRLQNESKARAAFEKRLKFLYKHEKKQENNPDARQLPGRQAKSAANQFLQRRERRAVEGIALLDVKKAGRKEAEKIETERKAIAVKEAALRKELKKEQTSVKQESEKDVMKTIAKQVATKTKAVSNGADSLGKGSSSKQLENIRAELALNDQDENLVSTENLRNKRNIIFLDFDNFPSFFRVLPHSPPEDMFVWAFYGGNFGVGRKTLNEIYFEMRQNGQVYISDRCGRTKDAADFALVLTVGKMDERLPSSVAFTIVSADKGFCEVERLMHNSSRSARVVNPKQDTDILLPLLRSLVEL